MEPNARHEDGSDRLRLADAPPPNPAWCRPATARAASVALAALGEDVSAAAALRQRLYEDFTEELWETVYFDLAELRVVDHPARTEIVANERMTPPPFPAKKLFTVSRPWPSCSPS